jgi:capsid protein
MKAGGMKQAAPVTVRDSDRALDDALAYYVRDIAADVFDGDVFPGSFGETKNYLWEHGIDYYTLRRRSLQLFTENLYAQGIIKRIVRNEIFTGLTGDPTPVASVLWPDMEEGERENLAVEYSEMMSEGFRLYGNDCAVFDYHHQLTFGEFQEQVRIEAMICGDGIIVNRINHQTGLPCWDWINGNYIVSPMEHQPKGGNKIRHGVELDRQGRHAAYWVREWKDGEYKETRIPVFGEKSGRQISWMVYGGEKLLNNTRGIPVLACVLFMLKDIDRYRNAEVRAAVVNAMLPLFIKKDASAEKGGSGPWERMKREQDKVNPPPADTAENRFTNEVGMVPGTVFDNLSPGEEPVSFNTNRPNVNFGTFEHIVISAICWYLELPPEIGVLKFTSSYAASRQANNELDITLKYRVFKNARDFCQLIYQEFVIQSCLIGEFVLPGFLPVAFNPKKWKERGAWLWCEWSGLHRPSVDINREAGALLKVLASRNITNDEISRRFGGIPFRATIYKIAQEEKIMRRLGIVSSINEDVQGNPSPDYTPAKDEGLPDNDDDRDDK